jgi:hypothetical protein
MPSPSLGFELPMLKVSALRLGHSAATSTPNRPLRARHPLASGGSVRGQRSAQNAGSIAGGASATG